MSIHPGLNYTGVVPVMPTPFHDDDDLDIDSLLRLLDFCNAIGVDGVTVLGVLGEAAALSDQETAAIVHEVCAAAQGTPVIVGASRPGVRPTRLMIEMAAGAGAAAVMVAPPSGDGTTERGIFAYFQEVADSSPLPVVIQDHPASTRVHMSAELLARLIDELDAVAGLKCEAVPTGPKIRAVRARTTRVPVLTGLGALYAASDLAAGSAGFNTGFAFPEVLTGLSHLAAEGELDSARALYRHFLPLIAFEQQPGPAIRKEIWRRRGILSSARVRSPGAQLDPWLGTELTAILASCRW